MRRLPLVLRGLVVAAGLSMLLVVPGAAASLWHAHGALPLLLVLPIILLQLLRVDIFPHARTERASFTLGTLGLFFLLALGGPDWAVAASALHSVVAGVWLSSPWYKTVYTAGITTASMWAVGVAAAWAGQAGVAPLPALLLTGLAVVGHVLLHTGSVTLALSMSTCRPFSDIWREHFAWVSIQQVVLALTGLALGHAATQIGWTAVFLTSPLLLLRPAYQRYVRSQSEHTLELERFANQLITTLAAVVDAGDAYTFGHSTQVSRYAVAMGQHLGYNPEQLERLRVGALLHDIGKVGIPESILFKPGKLDAWEYELMKEHTTIGYRIVSQIDRLQFAADIILQHHEWFDGRGYPRGLRGEEILRDARVVGVADALESMMSDRPYRKGRSLPEALAEIRRWSGTQFDPEVVRALERVAEQHGAGFFVNSAALVDEMHAGVVAAAGRGRYAALNRAAAAAQPGSLS